MLRPEHVTNTLTLLDTPSPCNIYGIVVLDSKSSIPLYARMDGVEPTLFSGFLGAVLSFSKVLKFGELSSFSTEEKGIYIATGSRITTAIVASAHPECARVVSLARRMVQVFEETFELRETSEVSNFQSFDSILDALINEM
jgi:hypothetical protein